MTGSTVTDDRWTCPSCGRSLVAYGSELDVRCAIIACQIRHAKAHAAAEAVLGRLGLPPRPKQTQRRKKAA